MDWRQATSDREVAHWKGKYERCVKLCKVIWDNWMTIDCIKAGIDREQDLYVSEVWNELDYEVQKLLITAPRYGGPFTTEERKKIKELWEISADDLERKQKK